MDLGQVWDGLTDPGSDSYPVVTELRLPRTVLGLAAGAALGLAGALMQAMTRNPLADPGLLGVNTGAAAAVVTASFFFGSFGFGQTIVFAFIGAPSPPWPSTSSRVPPARPPRGSHWPVRP